MNRDVSNDEYKWDEFRDWCEDEGVSLDHQDDWVTWWNCWVSAIDAFKGDVSDA